jgi:hypothetical protein
VANLIVSALATWNGKALNKGKNDVSAFDKSVTKLGKTFAGVFAASSIIAFSKKAVNAFAADQAAAKSLELQLINTGNAFRVSEVEGYLKSLEKTYAILTDLRVPFKTLLNVTGSIETSQRLLNSALNISAGTGESLDSVINAITSGLRGQTKGIKNLNTGIDANIIASGDMNKIMEALEARFKGQARARLDTFAGQMDVLTLSSKLATKAIGGGLVDALDILSKDNSVANLATDFENLGKNIAFVIVQLAKLLDKVSGITSSPSFKPLILLLGGAASAASGNPLPLAGAFGLVGAMGVGGALTKNYQSPLSDADNSALGRKRLADRVKAGKIQADLNKYNAQALTLLKAKSEVDKLKDKFDLERIGLTAALNAATDEETKLRLRSQLAILDNNEALAKKLLAEMNAAEAIKALTDVTKNASIGLASAFDMLSLAARNLMLSFGLSPSQVGPGGTNISNGGLADVRGLATTSLNNPNFGTSAEAMALGLSLGFTPGSSSSSSYTQPQEIVITVDTAAGGDRLSQAIAESIQIATKNGFSTVPAGQGF